MSLPGRTLRAASCRDRPWLLCASSASVRDPFGHA
jgi:hypothetical protein